MNFEKIYEFRFKNIDQNDKLAIWNVLSNYLYGQMGNPHTVLDPAAGRCEFANTIPSGETWAIEQSESVKNYAKPAIKLVIGNVMEEALPPNYFDGIFVSNFLEHLPSPDSIYDFLLKMHAALKPGGCLAIMGPNFKYCKNEYFDCADHLSILTEKSVEELLYSAGFEITRSFPKFLPFSFKTTSRKFYPLVNIYLRFPLFWRIFGQQFLIYSTK